VVACPPPARLLAVAALAGLACNQAEGVARIRCETTADRSGWPGCQDGVDDPLTFEADFFALQRFEDMVEIRLQQGGRGADLAEGFHLQVLDRDAVVSGCLRRSIPLAAPILEEATPERFPACREDYPCASPATCPLVRMALHFPRSCPDTAAPLVAGDPPDVPADDATSSVVFTSIGTRPGDTVAGSFDVRIADGRSGVTVGRCRTLDAGFYFVVKEGQPYVRFVE